MYKCVAFLLLFRIANGIIYRLNESQYSRMPAVYQLDDYEKCMSDERALYCTIQVGLVSETKSALMDLIREYSADRIKHFNHSLLHRGVCVTRSCKKHNHTQLIDTVEAWMNESLWHEFELKSRVVSLNCISSESQVDINFEDIAFAVLMFVILLINFIATVYDAFSSTEKMSVGHKALLCFSISRNWRTMVAPQSPDIDPRIKRLNFLYIIRALTVTLVIFVHASIHSVMFIDNPEFVENMYYSVGIIHLFMNGTVVVQTFFIISGFLITYNIKMYEEKLDINWMMFPKAIAQRLMRLTPVYAVTLGFVSTWARLVGSGPLWHLAVTAETLDCQQNWWKHLLYVNNYFNGSQCMLHSWYLAADTQLYILGIIIAISCRSRKAKILVLSLLATIGFILPTLQIYFQDLDALVLASPAVANNFYTNDKTFDSLHKRTHTNLFGFVTGLSLGYLVYYLQSTNFDIKKYKKYRLFYWLLLPIVICGILAASIFYRDGPRHSVTVRMLYGTLMKTFYCIAIVLFIIGMIFKIERIYRGICEWRAFVLLGRLSYSAFVLHMTLIRIFLGLKTTLTHASMFNQAQQSPVMIWICFVAAIPLHILVELPFARLLKIFQHPKKFNSSDATT